MAGIMQVQEIIRAKRNGRQLSAADIRAFIAGVADGTVGEAQLGAFLMAVFINGMNPAEELALTLAMRDSGTVLEWPELDGPVLDKHSTGGVGDLVSLVLAPLVAACGGYVPMISGRGLGHTGGTLDKLEAIPGFEVNPGLDRLRTIVREAGCAIVGQGPELAPADRHMYAVRDVTATVGCIPLIVSSILSKKLSEGLHALVMDIKVGNGAILHDTDRAGDLARAINTVARSAGLRCGSLMTDMNQPLASSAGNAPELREAMAILTGHPGNPRLEAVVVALATELLELGGLEPDGGKAARRVHEALDSGAAAERFARMVHLQGGPADLLERPGHYVQDAPVIRPVPAVAEGYVHAVDTRRIGVLVQALGGGRRRLGDTIDHRVGVSSLRRIGQACAKGEPLAVLHAPDEDRWRRAAMELQASVQLGGDAVTAPPALLGRVD